MMMSNLLSESVLQFRSINPVKSSGGLTSHRFTSIAYPVRNPVNGLSLTNRPAVGHHIRAHRDPATWFERDTQLNWIVKFIPIQFVSEQTVSVVERNGIYDRTLTTGIHLMVPIADKISHVYSLKPQAIPIEDLSVKTKDNIEIRIEGFIELRIIDPINASFGISGTVHTLIQKAEGIISTAFSDITWKQCSDVLVMEKLKAKTWVSIDEVAEGPGFECLSFEIWNMYLPDGLKDAMDTLVVADHKRKAKILEAEGERDAMLLRARTTKEFIAMMSDDLNAKSGMEVACFMVAQQYISQVGTLLPTNSDTVTAAFKMLAHLNKEGNEANKDSF